MPFTPDAAVDYWKTESEVMKNERKRTSKEVQALRDGISVWEESISIIEDYERFMAKELLDKGYKGPAAVVAGSVLEGHLRQLATKAEISVTSAEGKPRRAEALLRIRSTAGDPMNRR